MVVVGVVLVAVELDVGVEVEVDVGVEVVFVVLEVVVGEEVVSEEQLIATSETTNIKARVKMTSLGNALIFFMFIYLSS